MKKSAYFRRFAFSGLAILLAALTGCGGGGSSSSPGLSPLPSPPPLSITTSSLLNGINGQSYSETLQASGGTGSITWGITAGSLPTGLSLGGNTGEVSGTPDVAGTFNFTVQARDSGSPAQTATRSLSIQVVDVLAITTSSMPDGIRGGNRYSVTLQATGGIGARTWAIIAGSPPASIGIGSGTGEIVGDVLETGSFTFTVQVQDSGSPQQTATKELTILAVNRLVFSSTFLPGAQLNEPYSATLGISGGVPPFSWSLTSGSLLAGLSLNPNTGEISGSPTETGPTTFTLQVTDSTSTPQLAAATFTLAVADPLGISDFTIAVITDGKLGRGYRVALNANGGTPGYWWSVSNGILPTGLRLDPLGLIFGTPTEVGTFDFTLLVTDLTSPPQTDSHGFTVRIDDFVITTTLGALPIGVIGQPYSATLQATGGTPPYTWNISPGSSFTPGLPGGLTFNPTTGEISGTPQESGLFSLVVEAADSSDPVLTDSQFINLTINPLPHFVTTSFPDGVLGTSYIQLLQVSGGLFPYTLSLIAGAPPDGIVIQTGADLGFFFDVSGTPTATGTFDFTLQIADSSSPPLTATQDFSIRVNDPLQVTIDTLPEGKVAEPYSATLSATGGVLPYTWILEIEFSLPNGLALDPATGIIAGTPLEPLSNPSLFFAVEDSSNPFQRARKGFAFTIVGDLVITTSKLPTATVGVTYQATLSAIGGGQLLTWSIVDGNLPAGFTLEAPTGKINGVAINEETQTFTVQVADKNDPTVNSTRTLTLTTRSSPGRNDTIATATSLSSGSLLASISPYADPSDTSNPDNDFYELTSITGTVVTVEILAERLMPPSPLDSVIEIVDASGTRFSSCRDPGDSSTFGPLLGDNSPRAFDDGCINDDWMGVLTLDSRLEFLVPGTPGETVTCYVHVLDFRGDARPDLPYEIKISGAN